MIIGDSTKREIRSNLRNISNHLAFISKVKPINIQKALVDDFWVMAMHEELNQFERNSIWTLVPKTNDYSIIGHGLIKRNKVN